jgi:hypothetical protein
MQILNILKQALLKVIALLQPFGGKVATPKNSATAFIE